MILLLKSAVSLKNYMHRGIIYDIRDFFIFAGYLSGSILFAYLIPKYFYHIDICRLSDDQNPGAFNAFAHTGSKPEH